MSSNTGNAHDPGAGRGGSAAHGYETRDANTGVVLGFLGVLFVVLMGTLLAMWLVFRFFNGTERTSQPSSSFADVRRVPVGPELQVNGRQDLLKTYADQQQALEEYSWEDRKAGTVRIPIEQAMDLLVKKGLPVESAVKSGSGTQQGRN